eukprot:TRINITY_DN78841_c0_g1_i1.p1 TRINITY_DN78841_c0_g1~~TRINITY_DN78841_c0_g1_i1.p1  ORF type:complete len:415 (-),score=83.41 TRINITY_DN78841_c0_g1_i1:554-1798(-)
MAYVHIPFCRQRCRYCDFAIEVVGKAGDKSQEMLQYADAVVHEISAGGAGAFEWTNDDWQGKALRSVYFGGGTPSLLPIEGFKQILEALADRFSIEDDAEITVELDPATFDQAKAEALSNLGVNRASIGIQSLDDETLKLCGRGHSAGEARRAVAMVQKAGIQNVSADLLSGVPGQSEEQLRNDIRAIASLGVTHLSVYDLQYEEGTVFERRYPTPGEKGRPTDSVAAELYTATHNELTQLGFDHYEISSFARSGGLNSNRSRHNQGYWDRRPYAAFGNGAASFVSGIRATRPRKVEDYIAWVRSGGLASGLAEIDTSPCQDRRDPLCEALMLGLRRSDGVTVLGRAGCKEADACLSAAAKALSAWAESGHAEVSLQSNQTGSTELQARLKPPEGFLISDSVLSDVIAAILAVP